MYAALASVYDELTRDIDYASRAKFIDTVFKRNDVKGIVLDAGCGTGALTLLLAKRGYDMIGVDASPDMLSVAYKKLDDANLPVTFLQQDLCDLDLYGTVKGIVCMQDTLNHIGPQFEKAMSGFSLFIEHGGILIFDINTQYKHRHTLADNTFEYEFSNGVCVWNNSYDETNKRVELTVEISTCRAGSTLKRTDIFFEYDIEPHYLEELLDKYGFKVLKKIDGESYGDIVPESERILYVAKKL